MTVKEFAAKAWERVNAAALWVRLKMMGPGAALLVIAVALLLFRLGWKNLQIGGILGRLTGRPKDGGVADVVNEVPGGRVDASGNPIPLGTPDAEGHTQIEVVDIKTPDLFSDPNTVQYIPPGKTEAVTLQLPVGVKNTDVRNVVVISPEVVAVAVHDTSKVTKESVGSLLAKYKKV